MLKIDVTLGKDWSIVAQGTTDGKGKDETTPCFQLCRFSAPISFLGHKSFMLACKRFTILRYAIIAGLLAGGIIAVAADGASLPFGNSGSGGGSSNGIESVESSGWMNEQFERTFYTSDNLFNVASCPTLDSASSPWTAPSTNPFSFNASWSFFPAPSQASLHHADWRVHYFDTWKLVENLIAGQQYQLIMRGADPASIPILHEGQVIPLPDDDGHSTEGPIVIQSGLKVFTVPVDRLCVEETIGLAFVEMLGLREEMTMIGEYCTPTSACVVALNLPLLQSEYGNLTLRAEQVNANCDLVLGSNDAGPAGENQHVSFATTAESSLLARSEWIKFVATFFNRELAATAIFGGIQQRYNQTLALVQEQPPSFSPPSAADLPYAPSLPIVAWISMYAGTYTISTAPFKASYTADAGGVIFAPNVTEFTNVEEFHRVLFGLSTPIALVIDETFALDPTEYTLDSFMENFGLVNASVTFNASNLPFLQRGQVWRYDGLLSEVTQALDWFEAAVPNADALLADLSSILARGFHGNPILTNHTEVWFRNIARGDSVEYTPNKCSSESTPLSAIEAAEGSPQDDPAMVTVCPLVLLEPWTYSLGPDSSSDNGLTQIQIGLIIAACILVLALAIYALVRCRSTSSATSTPNRNTAAGERQISTDDETPFSTL